MVVIDSLFRTEASEKSSDLGEVVLVRPVSFSFIAIGAATIALVIVAFLLWGTYTKRSTVVGQLLPDSGVIKQYTSQQGVVIKILVSEGQYVQKGDRLFVLSAERKTEASLDVLFTVSEQVSSRISRLKNTLKKTEGLHIDEQRVLQFRTESLVQEIAKQKELMISQRRLMTLAKDNQKKYLSLVERGFASKEQAKSAEQNVLEQYNRLQAQERTLIALERELVVLHGELASNAVKHQIQLNALQGDIARVGQELVETEAQREFVITAAVSGIATAVSLELGQLASPAKSMVSIIPENAELLAVLYAPSSAMGFVKPGDDVLIRYQAFPYQKFGHAKGEVVYTSKTAIAGEELPSIGGFFKSQTAQSEPIYSIRVTLKEQTMLAYGKHEPLQAGMLLEADIMRETRRLYEWVLEPLFSLSGKL